MEVINLEDKFARFSERWSPKILARLNEYEIKAVKLQGEFVWHRHDETDELFLVTKGTLVIRFRDRDVAIGPGELRPKRRHGRGEGRILPRQPGGALRTFRLVQVLHREACDFAPEAHVDL